MTSVIDKFTTKCKGQWVHTPLSNFWSGEPVVAPDYRGRILSGGDPALITWPSSENYYQAAKVNPSHPDWFRWMKNIATGTVGQSKQLGRKAPLASDWEEIKLDVMRKALEHKFVPGSLAADYLLATGDAMLIEGNTWGDRFWGVDGTGANWLGWLLMSQRAYLRSLPLTLSDYAERADNEGN